MRLLGWIRDHFFPDVRSLFLWPLAVAWLVAIGGLGWELFQVRGRGLIVGGVLMAFSPMPVLLLWTRPVPDREREAALAERRRQRLAKRTSADRHREERP